MDPALPSKNEGSPVFDPFNSNPIIELSIKGEGFSLAKVKFPLNWYGGTHFRIQETKGPIDEWVLDASLFKGILSFSVHTHNNEGKRTPIYSVEDLKDGDELNEDVVLQKDGVDIPLHIYLKYQIVPMVNNFGF